MRKFLGILAVVLLSAGLLTACGSSNSGDPVVAGTTTETTGSPGAWTINMTGGNGGTGGAGGYWYMETYQVQGVKLLKAGTASTTFTVPNYNPPVDLGTNLCTASTNTTVVVYPAGAATDPASNVLYMVAGSNYLYKGAGAGAVTLPVASEQCTGLKVNSGVTLTLGLNYDSDTNGAYDEAYLLFPNGDVDIDGILKTADLTTTIIGTPDTRHSATGTNSDMGALYIEAQQVFVHSTGLINTKGLYGTVGGQRGGDGGYIEIYAYNYFANNGTIDNSGGNGFDLSASSTTDGGWAGVSSGLGNYIKINVKGNTGPNSSGTSGGGVFINTGKINTNGGSGGNGGDASEVDIEANSDVFNTGTISSNAGKGTNGNGGNGNHSFYIESYYGSIYNSGPLSQTGGNGTTGGGDGGNFNLYAGYDEYSGDVVNSGGITADAGSATISGSGGSAKAIYMYAYGAIKTSGKISANGGDSMGANTGGSGGYMWFQNYAPRDYGYGEYMPVRPIQVSGNIYLNGGSSVTGTGGTGGSFSIYQAESDSSARSNTGVQLLGYASANLSGGDGASSGGDGYKMYIYTKNDQTNVGNYSPAGPIQNQIAITMKGGKGTGASSSGGKGGYLDWESVGHYSSGGVSTLTNSGKIDVSGGSGGTAGGGHSNEIYWYGQDGVNNSGALTLRGGNSTGGTGGDGAFNGLYIYASADIVNSGAIDTTGGSGTTGGNGSWWTSGSPFGDWVQISAGGKVTNSGSITCVGGAGTVANGNGGGIDILSEVGGTANTGALNIAPGGGAGTAGNKGQIWIDWVQVK